MTAPRHPATQAITTSSAASSPAARRPVLLLLAAALTVLAAGCVSPDRTERSLKLIIETDPPGAEITAAAYERPEETVNLGRSPVTIEGLYVVRRVYPNGLTDYWLRDAAGSLPPNPAKPPYASAPYLAGNDYPLDLVLGAALEGRDPDARRVRFDRSVLAALYEGGVRQERIRISLRAEDQEARAGDGTASANATTEPASTHMR